MSELHLRVAGMGGRGFIRSFTALLRDVPGVQRVTANVEIGLVVVNGTMSRHDVLAAVERSGHDVAIQDPFTAG